MALQSRVRSLEQALAKLTVEHEAAQSQADLAKARAAEAVDDLEKAQDTQQALELKVRQHACRCVILWCGWPLTRSLTLSCFVMYWWPQVSTNEMAVTLMREELDQLTHKLGELQAEKERERAYFVSSLEDRGARLEKADGMVIDLERNLAANQKQLQWVSQELDGAWTGMGSEPAG